MSRLLLAALLLVTVPGAAAAAELTFQGDSARPGYGELAVDLPPAVAGALAAVDLDADAISRALSLTVAAKSTVENHALPAVYGDHRLDGTRLIFRPAFPLAAGLELVARFDGEALAPLIPTVDALDSVTLTVRTAASEAVARTQVMAISPASQVVPTNLLRLYLHFSAPMRDHDVARHIRVLDAEGRAVQLPFVEIRDGLWDPQRRRLTLFFHPGRLKRGVGPNLALGTPLREGERYTLVVDRSLRDAAGLPLAEEFRHPFVAGPADRESPDPASWRVEAPAAETRQPLTVVSPEPLDAALLRRLVHLETATGEPVVGAAEVSPEGMRWRFTPTEPWSHGYYSLLVDPELEDLAGNSIGRRFEEEAGEATETVTEPRILQLTVGLP